MKETYYFSHDSTARNDEKILCLRAEYGNEGYGIYWILIEMMFENQETQLSYNHIKGISYTLNVTEEFLTKFINFCIEYNLFVSDGENFWSESLRKRKDKYIEKRNLKVQAGIKSGNVRKQKQIEQVEYEQTVNEIEQTINKNEQTTNKDEQTANVDEQTMNKNEQNVNKIEQNVNRTRTDCEQNVNKNEQTVNRNEQTVNKTEQNANKTRTEMNKYKNKNKNKLNINNIDNIDNINNINNILYTEKISSPPEPPVSEEGEKFALFFKNLLPPTQKITKANLTAWALTFDKLIRDKRPKEEIYQVTEWARKDPFWGEQGNFLSASKLQKKNKDGVLYYDVFLQKFKQSCKSNGTTKQQVKRPYWITESIDDSLNDIDSTSPEQQVQIPSWIKGVESVDVSLGETVNDTNLEQQGQKLVNDDWWDE